MKKLFAFLVVVSFATLGFGQITNTAHDLSGETWNASGEICIVCHTPHNATAVTGAVLWNRTTTATVFTPYTSGTLNATLGTPTGTSLLCLSCHDGTIALEDFGGATGGTAYVGVNATFDASLTTDHPISFTYDAALVTADGGLVAHDDANVAALLIGGKVECASCHDVHNAGFAKLLRVDNTGSALCLTCHDK